MERFSDSERKYLASQRLGRLATVDAQAAPQNNPVGFRIDDDGTVVIIGRDLGQSRKFRNVAKNGNVALVVDDIASVSPWRVRGVEIRGHAQTRTDVVPAQPGISPEEIRITPERIISWGIDQPVG
jgi:pyridoxamine 5'-phosphate oxidase family protein